MAGNPGTPSEALLRSFTYAERVSLEEHAAATQALERALDHAPDSSDCWAMLAMLRTDGFIHGFDASAGALDRALAAARAAVDKDPSNHKAYQSLAWTLCFRKEHSAALAAAERTIALNPLDACAKVYMGQLMVSAGAWDRGVALVREALPLNPNHPGWYWYPLYCDAYRHGDYRGALEHALKMNMPDFPLTHVALAAAYGQLGDQTAGTKAIRDLLALRPDFPEVAARELGKIWDESLTAALLDGLRKAGLETAMKGLVSRAVPGSEGFWVAVAPFRADSGGPELAGLASGLTEEIVAGLSRFSYLRVLTKGTEGARYVLEGSLRQAGAQLRVAVKLIDTGTGANLWAEGFSRPYSPGKLFELQDELTPLIVSPIAETNGVLEHNMWIALRDHDSLTLGPHEAMVRSFGYLEVLTREA